jgi:hypothetical protein
MRKVFELGGSMAKFYVTVKNISYYTVVVEAESRDDAVDNFNWNDIDWSDPEYMESDISEVYEQIKEEDDDF